MRFQTYFVAIIYELNIFNSCFAHSLKDDSALDFHARQWGHWNLNQPATVILILLLIFYSRGLLQYNKIVMNSSRESRKRTLGIFYYLGWAFLFISLVSPLDTMSDSLAWAHMLQHTLILMVSAPLMAFSGPNYIAQWGISPFTWRRLGKFRTPFVKVFKLSRYKRPLVAWVLYAFTLWIWHLPQFYQAALNNESIHNLQHISFFITSFLFWRVLFDPFQKKLRPLIGILYIFVSSLHGIILGALMGLSSKLWYNSYLTTAPQFGFSPLEDQQIAGFIMWMPAGISYALAALFLLKKIIHG